MSETESQNEINNHNNSRCCDPEGPCTCEICYEKKQLKQM